MNLKVCDLFICTNTNALVVMSNQKNIMTTNSKAIMAIALLAALSVFVAFATIPAITPTGNLVGYGPQKAYAMRPCLAYNPPDWCSNYGP